MKPKKIAGIAVCLIAYTITGHAQSPDETETPAKEGVLSVEHIKASGYIRSGIFGGEKEIRNYYGEGSLKLEVPISSNTYAFSEVRYRADGDNNHKFGIREAYVNLILGQFDLRVGEQIVLWGRADGFNPTNNITPQDFCAYSPEEDDKRLGNFVVRGVFSPCPFRIEVDWIPVYKSSLFPFVGKTMGERMRWSHDKRPYRWEDQSFGVKIDLEKPSFDLSLSYYNGLYKSPGITYKKTPSQTLLSQEPYQVHIIGMDFSTSLGNYGLRGELAYSLPYKSNSMSSSTPQKQLEYTIGLDRSWDNFSLIVQYIGKYIPDLDTGIEHNPMEPNIHLLNQIIFAQHEQWNHSISIRPSLSLLYETLNLEMLGLCKFSTREYFFQPKVRYAIADAVTLSVGGQLFYGPDDRLFGILEKTKNAVFTELKISF